MQEQLIEALAEALMWTSDDPRADERGADYWHERATVFIRMHGVTAALDRIREYESGLSTPEDDAYDAMRD